ncbi:hypothetical protein ACLOJK_034490 [Asimina triloba]
MIGRLLLLELMGSLLDLDLLVTDFIYCHDRTARGMLLFGCGRPIICYMAPLSGVGAARFDGCPICSVRICLLVDLTARMVLPLVGHRLTVLCDLGFWILNGGHG